jgi:hypothetical protein
VSRISEFLKEIDRRWTARANDPPKILLRIIGSAALMLQTGYERGTKDSDVLETASMTADIKERLTVLAGAGTELHDRHKIYVDIVSPGLPFLPQAPLCHPLADLNRELARFDVEVLDIIDTVVSKLKRFNANDISDIQAMANMGLVNHPTFIERFRSAVDVFSMDARADDLPDYVKNLHRIERDHLLVAETPIELPHWI